MAVTVISRPLGHKLTTVDIEAEIIDSGTGQAQVYTGTGHGLSDGDYVYIDSNIESYNGFKLVDSIGYDNFKIKDSDSDYTPYKQNEDISFRISVLDHGWQCVHLPIVYELHSDLLPNDVDTIYLLGSPYSAGAYMDFILADTSGVTALEYLWFKESALDPGAAYQVLSVVSIGGGNSVITINKASSDLYSAQIYYNNYHILVNVYGGLLAGHRWEDEKPFELLATLKLIPDSNGDVKFSIAEILKGQITTRNNLTLDTLPNNLDFHTQFYITYAESYDSSDGDEITIYTSSVTNDLANFLGRAINAMLPFKSLNSGHLSDYINYYDYLARWLTVQERPQAYVDRFFDLSFLTNTTSLSLSVDIIKKLNGDVVDTEILSLGFDIGQGLIRVPIIPESGYDEYCIQVKTIDVPELSEFVNADMPGFVDWVEGDNPYVTMNFSVNPDSKLLKAPLSTSSGTYTFEYSINYTGTNLSALVNVRFDVMPFPETYTLILNSGLNTGTFTKTLSGPSEEIGFYAYISNTVYRTITILSFGIPGVSSNIITESICIDIIDECQSSIVNDNLRLMEGGEFRELE